MTALLGSLSLFAAGALASLLLSRRGRWSTYCGAGAIVAGAGLGLVPALHAVLGGAPQSFRLAWDVPYGSLDLRLDALSAFFLLPIFVIAPLAALYGSRYLEAYRGHKALAPQWFFLNLLVASMVMVVLARNALLFLMAWELMALTSFFLVTFEDEQAAVRQAGWIYLVASHIGTAFLFVLFILLGRTNGSLDFDRFSAAPGTGVLFVLALIGFGTKAGFVPLHVWLPEAHPAAPSHVSAIMSAVMIKTGIYGLLRILTLLGPAQAWWGWTLCLIGLSSGILGVLLALAQPDLKRLLAYSSVENIGIIALGLGVGVIGVSMDRPVVAVAGFAGALLHVLNHALFKSLLFLGAGNLAHATHTRQIDRLGGLLSKMPGTGATFLVGAAAVSGLPPLNGFIGEFLIYVASFKGVLSLNPSQRAPMLATIAGLALIGGLAAACFTRAFGMVFLGHPRSQAAERANEAKVAMLVPVFALAGACLLVGLCGAAVIRSMDAVVATATGLPSLKVTAALAHQAGVVAMVCDFGAAALLLTALLSAARAKMLAGREVRIAPTWDCGYASPSARMQYTASSFAQPLTDSFAMLLKTRQVFTVVGSGIFPQHAEFRSHTDDPYQRYLFGPLFRRISRAMGSLRPFQQGKVQLYVLYIAVTLLLLFLWQIA
ncbi:MAG TPA: proton-conducting transporter membrane subunit [Candidatus Binataceae bacterium]|nr:proton-conducting transporter membrane subunit [Candidatus Binataceae bacterium]